MTERETKNFRLRTTNLGYLFIDKRVDSKIYFTDLHFTTLGGKSIKLKHSSMDNGGFTRTGYISQDLPSQILDELKHIEEYGRMRSPDEPFPAEDMEEAAV